jgi:hypothetical protein
MILSRSVAHRPNFHPAGAIGTLSLEPMKMRQSLSTFERAFEEEMEIDRQRREAIHRATQRRARKRTIERNVRMGRMRFVVLSLTLATTAIVVSVVMFKVLYMLMQ